MATLPSDSNPTNWGTSYNTWLQVEHGDDGTHSKIKDPLYDVRAYGAAGDGSTVDTTAIDAASTANPLLATTPKSSGTYVHGDTSYTLSGNFSGTGNIETSDGERGNNVRRLLSAPSTLSNGNSVADFWTNDFSFLDNYDIVVDGAATVGQPTTGYQQYDQVHPQFFGAYYGSGYNHSTTDATGRTGWAVTRYRLQQDGDGDAFCLNLNCVVSNENASHTGLFGTPAGGLWNGNITAAANQVYLNPVEYNIQSGIYDVRAAGLIVNMDRDENAAADGEWWCGVRIQSTGDDPIDAAYQATGSLSIGVDLTPATVTNAIALKDGQKIHFDAETAVVGGANTYADTFNNSYIWMTSSVWQMFHTGTLVQSCDGSIMNFPNVKTTVDSIATDVVEKTSTYVMTALDSVILIDASAPTSPTFTLPSAAAWGAGKAGRVTLKRTGAGGTVTIQRSGSDNIIDKSAATVTSFTLAANEAVELVSDGVDDWHILYIA